MPLAGKSPGGRWNRRAILQRAGAFGALGALWTLGCGPGVARPVVLLVAPVDPVLLRRAATPEPTAPRVSDPIRPLPTPTTTLSAVPTRTPTAVATPTSVPPTPTPQPSATPQPTSAPPTRTPIRVPTKSPTPLTYDERRLVDVVGQASRSYANDSGALATNIEVAARKIDGAVVAPGAVFSFLDRLGPQTTAAGFVMGYGITVVNGQAQTVPMLAGGICDVSTLLFQAVYRAGLKIVTRYSHSYWIASYGQPPDGGLGLEATVDVQPVDFRFANSTGDWLKISCVCSSGTVAVTLRGVQPGWAVAIEPAVVANVVPTDPTVVRRSDPSLPVGAQVVVEAAQNGFDVTRGRTVTKGKQVIDRYAYTAHYLPSHNVVLVGGPASTPTPTPTKVVEAPDRSPTARLAQSAPPPTGSTVPQPTATVRPSPTPVVIGTGNIRVPNFVGLAVGPAQLAVTAAGLANTYVNYQGPADVPLTALQSVPVGAVVSQQPPPGAIVPKGTTVFLAVRKG